MRHIFSPAVQLMNRLNYPVKFLLIGFFVFTAISILLGSLAYNAFTTINLTRKEIAATELLRPLNKSIQLLQQHRGLSAGLLGGNQAMQETLNKKQGEVQETMAAVDLVQQRYSSLLGTATEWQEARKGWEEIRANGLALPIKQNFAEHSALIARLGRLQVNIADQGALNGDPDIDSFYLIDTLVNKLPQMLERLAVVRGQGTGVLARQIIQPQEEIDFAVHSATLRSTLAGLQLNLEKAGKQSPAQQSTLSRFSQELGNATQNTLQVVSDELLGKRLGLTPKVYFEQTSIPINVGYQQLFETLFPALEKLLDARIDRLQHQLMLQVGLAVFVCLALAYLSLGVYFSVIGAVRQLSAGAAAIAGGDLTTRIDLDSHDELSQIATSFNSMAGTFNRLLGKMQQTAGSLSGAAHEMASSAASVSQSSQVQSDSATSMAAAVEEMTVGINEIREHAKMAQKTSARSGELSVEGGRMVEETAREMEKIAEAVNQSARSVEELGRQSKQISSIVGVIKGIADQTNLLALNAAIEAARAGESGRGFAVVADEVRTLAESTTRSTQEISSMIEAIQQGTREAVARMSEGVERVNDGVALSRQAGEAMSSVRSQAEVSSQEVADISDSLNEQSAASNEIANNVERIATMVEQNSSAIRTAAETAHLLEVLADEMQSEVRSFRVS